ncbi:hypothetical protein, partial [Aquitalea magnusonii]|uniref:hypothetical protein n=1 Tax=Aquitalea magnusonii TaxID=332411 RepID=UPI00137B374F
YPGRLTRLIRDEIMADTAKYGDKRRSEIKAPSAPIPRTPHPADPRRNHGRHRQVRRQAAQ